MLEEILHTLLETIEHRLNLLGGPKMSEVHNVFFQYAPLFLPTLSCLAVL